MWHRFVPFVYSGVVSSDDRYRSPFTHQHAREAGARRTPANTRSLLWWETIQFCNKTLNGPVIVRIVLKAASQRRTMDTPSRRCTMGIFEFFHVIWLTQRIFFLLFNATPLGETMEIDYYASQRDGKAEQNNCLTGKIRHWKDIINCEK